MSGIGSATDPGRINAMLSQIAQDAGQEPQAQYRALGATFSDKKAELAEDQNRSLPSAGLKVGGMLVAKAVGAKLTTKLESAAELATASCGTWAPTLRLASAGNAIVGAIGMGYELMDKGFVRAHAHGDALRDAAANDAMMVGVSQALEAPAGFKAAMAQMRPETATQGGAAVAAQLAGKDKGDLPLLQYNADAGLTGARAWAEKIARAKTPDEQKQAMTDMNQSEVGRLAKDNAAYGVGVAEALWAVGARTRGEISDADYQSLFTSANARMDALIPPR